MPSWFAEIEGPARGDILKDRSVAYPVLDAAGELPAHRSDESDLVALPTQAGHPTVR
jgi:hypothetical protein